MSGCCLAVWRGHSWLAAPAASWGDHTAVATREVAASTLARHLGNRSGQHRAVGCGRVSRLRLRRAQSHSQTSKDQSVAADESSVVDFLNQTWGSFDSARTRYNGKIYHYIRVIFGNSDTSAHKSSTQ